MRKTWTIIVIASVLIGIFVFFEDLSENQSLEKQEEEKSLVFGIQPYKPKAELVRDYSPIVKLLEEKLNKNIEIKIPATYDGYIKNVGMDIYDIAIIGPSPYVQMVDKYGKKQLIVQFVINQLPWFHGTLIVKDDSPYRSVKDLNAPDTRIALGPIYSTITHYVLEGLLVKNGFEQQYIKNHDHFEDQDLIVKAVLNGTHQVGGVLDNVAEKYKSKGIRVLKKSDPIATHVFLVPNTRPDEFVQKLKQIFINIEDKSILTSIRKDLTGFTHANDLNFNFLRDIMAMHKPHYNE